MQDFNVYLSRKKKQGGSETFFGEINSAILIKLKTFLHSYVRKNFENGKTPKWFDKHNEFTYLILRFNN